MVIPILASVAGLATVLFLVMIGVAGKRADRISALLSELADFERRADSYQSLSAGKSRQTDELRSKLDKTREELKKLKKKAFEKEHSENVYPAPPDEEHELAREEALLEAKAETKRLREQAGQANEEVVRMREQANELKAEVQDLKKTIENDQDKQAEVKQGESSRVGDLEKQVRKLKDKLEAASRRARTDSQVYRVTNSKLELAMDRIADLEKRLGAKNKAEQGA